MKKLILLAGISFIFFLIAGCSKSEEIQKERQAWNEKNSEVYFGVAAPFEVLKAVSLYDEGLLIAVEDINNRGGVLGKKLVLVKADDEGSITKGMSVAEEFIEDERISAVIGHWYSRVTQACAENYEKAGLLMITPGATNPNLIKPGYNYIFRNTLNDIYFAKGLVDYASKKGFKRVAIFYSDQGYGRLANEFDKFSNQSGIKIVDRISYMGSDEEFKRTIDKLKAMDCDSIFLADVLSPDGNADIYIKKMIENGLNVPVIGADGIDSVELMTKLGKDAENIMVGTFFSNSSNKKTVKDFVEKFVKKYNKQPDTWAAQGYETVNLLVNAINKVKSLEPNKIAEGLRDEEGYEGITGTIKFTKDGESLGKEVIVKVVKDGKFVFQNEQF